jgi:hypothetical protein
MTSRMVDTFTNWCISEFILYSRIERIVCAAAERFTLGESTSGAGVDFAGE